MSEENKDTLWRKYCMWWKDSPLMSSFLFAFLVSMMVGIILPPMTAMTSFLVTVAIILLALNRMDKAVKQELKDVHTEMQDSGEFDELKHILMTEAKRMADKQAGRDPDRTLRAVCHNCDSDIYSDDKMYTNGKQNCYCDVCWDIEGARD
jgi:hypothetical protein